MSGKEQIIGEFRSFANLPDLLKSISYKTWFSPIAPGKATIAGIVAHLLKWDDYMIREVLPAVRAGGGIQFPEFDAFNAEAYRYAESGISKDELLEAFREKRMELCMWLEKMDDSLLLQETTANGVALCPHTGQPYTLLYIIEEFIGHDRHHQDQIERAFPEFGSGMRDA